MAITVSGVLRTPMNIPVFKVPIRIVTVIGSGETLETSTHEVTTDNQGNYSFELVTGEHVIYAKFTDVMEEIGSAIVTDQTPTPLTISELLEYTTPVQPDIVQDIYDEINDKFNNLLNDLNTEVTRLDQSISDGDAAVSEQMRTYTNECLGACAATLTETVQAGDAVVLSQAAAYADDKGNELAQNINVLSTRLNTICQTMCSLSDANNVSIQEVVTCLDNQGATLRQEFATCVDNATNILAADLEQIVTACNAQASTCLSALNQCINTEFALTNYVDSCLAQTENNVNNQVNATNQCIIDTRCVLTENISLAVCDIKDLNECVELQRAGYAIVTCTDNAVASINLLAASYTNSDVGLSEILMRADKLTMWNGLCGADGCRVYPFIVRDNKVLMNCAIITDLCSVNICSSNIQGTVVRGGSFTSINWNANNCCGFCIDGETGNAEFNQVAVRADIVAKSLTFDSLDAIPEEIENQRLGVVLYSDSELCTKVYRDGSQAGSRDFTFESEFEGKARLCLSHEQFNSPSSTINWAVNDVVEPLVIEDHEFVQEITIKKGSNTISFWDETPSGSGDTDRYLILKKLRVFIGNDEAINYIDTHLYAAQSPLQISGGGYREEPTKGWGIHENGTAVFNGGIRLNNAGIIGGTIYGARVISEGSFLAVDADGDGNTSGPEYYDGHSGEASYIMFADELVEYGFTAKRKIRERSGTYFDYALVPAYNRNLPINDTRARFTTLPEGTFQLEVDEFGNTGSGHGYAWRYELLGKDMSTILYTSQTFTAYVDDSPDGYAVLHQPFLNAGGAGIGMNIGFRWTFDGADPRAYRHKPTMRSTQGTYGWDGMPDVGGVRVHVIFTDSTDSDYWYARGGYVRLDNTVVVI